MSKPKKSSLQESKGVSVSETTNTSAIAAFKSRRHKTSSLNELASGILAKNITALSQSITLIESQNPKHFEQAKTLIKTCLPHANKSIRIGITGVPGVGKSTFIETFGKHLTSQGKRVAVLAIDPSSTISKGSILGDKTRMGDLVKDDNVFIRPSASGTSLGGVARKTRESIVLCEAAGFDVILIETVGVGQSETTVHSMVDFFLLLKLPGAGDALQGIKRGIIELADAIAINKADGDNLDRAKIAQIDFNSALHLYPKNKSGWQPKVTVCSALRKEGIDAIWKQILDYVRITTENNYFIKKRNQQNKFWLIQTIEHQLSSQFFNNPEIEAALNAQIQLLENNKTTPFAAAELLLKMSS
ncbi:methylmalonyl Co-A mutase-associated GTPase MeaB [Tamlana agarivorans]|uniref:Methylmalonyl Co-A mutase-associated GTPase MeaB n=1 Tax=Pseudotamlana agarivorans TaxID=481183 RepID=A0ACC5UAZ4_9FLAO|nr:methylmalonyl Co-A mutase-associated GTPase MeaB [Tamlana agarivorans]